MARWLFCRGLFFYLCYRVADSRLFAISLFVLAGKQRFRGAVSRYSSPARTTRTDGAASNAFDQDRIAHDTRCGLPRHAFLTPEDASMTTR
jgi:hypothetical protein